MTAITHWRHNTDHRLAPIFRSRSGSITPVGDSINPASTWHQRVKQHIATFPEGDRLSISAAGFAPGWDQAALWA
jgi:hypothetical protein